MTLLPEVAATLVFVCVLVAYWLGLRRGERRERRNARVRREGRMRQLAADLRDEGRAEREAIAEMCAILGPREVSE